MNIDLKFIEHISKIVHIGHGRAALILNCFHASNPEMSVKTFVLMCVLCYNTLFI